MSGLPVGIDPLWDLWFSLYADCQLTFNECKVELEEFGLMHVTIEYGMGPLLLCLLSILGPLCCKINVEWCLTTVHNWVSSWLVCPVLSSNVLWGFGIPTALICWWPHSKSVVSVSALFIMNSETAFHNSVPAGSIFLWSCFFKLLGISTDSLICVPRDWGHCFFAAKFYRQLWGCRHVNATRCWCIWIEGFDYLHSFTGDARAVCPAGKTEWIWNCNLHMSCIPCNTLCTCFPQPYSWSVYR